MAFNFSISFSILHCSGNKDCFTDKFTSLHNGNAKTSAPSVNNFEDISSKQEALYFSVSFNTAASNYFLICLVPLATFTVGFRLTKTRNPFWISRRFSTIFFQSNI